jgi:nicotinamidase-related amidase
MSAKGSGGRPPFAGPGDFATRRRPKQGPLVTSSTPDPRAGGFALLTIDMQRDFALPSSPAHIPGTEEAAEQTRTLVKVFRSAGRPIVHTVRLYLPDGSNAELSRRPYLEAGNHLVCPGTPGAELLDPLKPDPGVSLDGELLLSGGPQQVGPAEWIMYKPRWGAFYATFLEDHLRSLGVDTIMVCGCNFPNCPRTTIYEASERDFHIVFVPDATSGVYPRGLDELKGIAVALQGVDDCAAWVQQAPIKGSKSA